MMYKSVMVRRKKHILLVSTLSAVSFFAHAVNDSGESRNPTQLAEDTNLLPAAPTKKYTPEKSLSPITTEQKTAMDKDNAAPTKAPQPAPPSKPISKIIPSQASNNKAYPPSVPKGPEPKKETIEDEKLELPLAFQPSPERIEEARQALKTMEKEERNIEFNFVDADLLNLVSQIEEIFDVRFIPDDIVDPLKQGRKALKGNKISFKTNKPLNKRQAWNLFITFLNLAGLTITPYPDDPDMYFITVIKSAYTMPTPTYIGVDYSKLPTTDQLIRYVYFVENMTTETLKKIVDSLKSPDAVALELKSNRALLLIDKAYNVRELLKIVKELDQASMPQAMSIIKLRYADAKVVEELYKTLTQVGDTSQPFMGPRKQPTSLYFPENTRVIAEPRTNALILLGEKDAIAKMEDFIVQNIDVDLEQPYARLHTYQVHHADAKAIADIMNRVTEFGKESEVGKSGGVRGQDKYLRPMQFTAEPATNRIIVRGHYEDYLKAKEIMDQLDAPQPQVGIEVLVLTVSLVQMRQLGVQLRSKQPGINGLLGNNVKFQTSGLYGTSGIQQNLNGFGVDRILGNLVNLAQGANPGNTIVTFGQDIVNGALSVWGIFAALQSVVDTTVVSNPFLVASNKTRAQISIGESRRVQTSEIIGSGGANAPTFDNAQAFLTVKITPQINSDGMIILDIQVDVNSFTNIATADPTNPLNAEMSIKSIKSNVIVANKEVLALGGLVQTTYTNKVSKTPLLGEIPLLGWLFKNKQKSNDKESLLVLISTRIIDANNPDDIVNFTAERMADYYTAMEESTNKADKRDPINRWFFDPLEKEDPLVNEFLAEQNTDKAKVVAQNRKRREKRRRNGNRPEPVLAKQAQPSKPLPEKLDTNAVIGNQPKTGPERLSDLVAHNYDVEKDLFSRVKNKKRTSLSLNNFLPAQEKGRSA